MVPPPPQYTGQLAGKVAVITGASRGVGAELAKVYGREGASVVVNYFQNREAAVEVVTAIEDAGGHAVAQYGDVTNPKDMEYLAHVAAAMYGGGTHQPLTVGGTEFVSEEKGFGKIDILVNNALVDYKFDATSAQTSISTVEWENFESQFQGTIRGAVNATKAVLPYMEGNKYGKIINIGTNLMYDPVVTYYDYTTTKAALVGLTRNLAKELGPQGIRVNLVAGGLLETTDASSLTSPEVFGYVADGTPLKKNTTVSDFAEACVYFAAPASDAVTGQSLSVDGGLTMP
mmetsp:Transcript_7395/g.8599  ORF Transcript_7395/g.8599 Transcript_7395/m.8599 type:complete len:288 (+) Transcript_7395:88-951(+)